MQQLFPTSEPLKIVSEPPVILEPLALVAGFVVGFIGWIVHRAYFVTWYGFMFGLLYDRVLFPRQFDSVYAFINLSFALNQAFIVGFVVGTISRWHPYRLTPIAIILTFFLKSLHDAFDIWQDPRRPYEVVWVGWLLLLIYTLVPLLGTYMKRERRVSVATSGRGCGCE